MKLRNPEAFPRASSMDGGTEAYSQDGMSLRDWFAGKALQGMNARDTFDECQATPQQRARLAYIDADAMLAERAK